MITLLTTRALGEAQFLALRHPRLRRASARVFVTLAGLAANLRPLPVEAACCGGFGGTGHCGATNCNGGACQSGGGVNCGYNSGGGCPTGGACWDEGCGLCCDCFCSQGSFQWYCYCGN